MGRRGPAPKPSQLKDLEGTRRPDREASNQPSPDPGIPELPAGWAREAPWAKLAVAEYRFISPRLKRLGLLSEIDRAALLAYCDAYGRWIYYRRRVWKSGSLQKSPKGMWLQHPNVSLMNRALDDVKRFLALFGLSPADRTRVSAMKPEEEKKNPFLELMK